MLTALILLSLSVIGKFQRRRLLFSSSCFVSFNFLRILKERFLYNFDLLVLSFTVPFSFFLPILKVTTQFNRMINFNKLIVLLILVSAIQSRKRGEKRRKLAERPTAIVSFKFKYHQTLHSLVHSFIHSLVHYISKISITTLNFYQCHHVQSRIQKFPKY